MSRRVRIITASLALSASAAQAHPLEAIHVHSETDLMLAGALALIITALGLALVRHKKGGAK